MGKHFKVRGAMLAAVLLLAGVAAGTLVVPKVSAGICWHTLSCGSGWFSGNGPDTNGQYPQDWWDVLDGGIHSTNLSQFLSDISGHLKCVNPDTPGATMGVPQNDNNGTGSAFIVLTMLGANPKTPKNQACVRWSEWKDLVTQYDQAGLVNYNFNMNPVNVNTFYTHSWGGDIGFDKAAPSGPAIVFFKADGSGIGYAIRHECGNPVGVVEGLPPIKKQWSGDVSANCNTITGHAFDSSNTSYAVPVTISYSLSGVPNTPATANAGGTHDFSANTPQEVRSSTSAVTITAKAKAANGTVYDLSNSPITIGPCLQPDPQCGNFTVSPASLDPSTPFSVTVQVDYNNAAIRAQALASGAKFFLNINGPGVNRSYPSVQPITQYGVGGLQITSQQAATGQAGEYTIGWGITGPYGSKNCGAAIVGNANPPVFEVASKPYFSVSGGDISAGAGMSAGGNDCAVASNPKAGIVSWNQGSAGNYGGAGTQYAALALGNLQDFASGQGSAMAPSGLSFANTADGGVNVAGGLFGGKFDGPACTADYFGNATNVQTGNVTIGGQTIANGTHKTIYVDGNVYITGNIVFSGATGSYANTSQIPSFSIIVRGNIYVAPGVTQLDGFYIAQPSSASATNGVIYTCASGAFTAAPLNRNLQSTCNTALTVNGAFVGRQVWLLRTAGSLSSTPAEKFNYVPELWLSAPFDNGLGGASGDYDSITSLPPVL